MARRQHEPTEAELASMSTEELEAYAATFTDAPEPLEPAAPRRLDSAITVRFTSEELDTLRGLADEAGVKVTALIRRAAVAGALLEADRIRSLEEKRQAVTDALDQFFAAAAQSS